jgi:hypothetical protein
MPVYFHAKIFFLLYFVPSRDTGVKEFFQQNNLPILPPTVLNKVILFLASKDAAGTTGEKFIGKDF